MYYVDDIIEIDYQIGVLKSLHKKLKQSFIQISKLHCKLTLQKYTNDNVQHLMRRCMQYLFIFDGIYCMLIIMLIQTFLSVVSKQKEKDGIDMYNAV